MTDRQLEVRDASIAYGEVLAVQGADLTLAAGQIGCLLGP